MSRAFVKDDAPDGQIVIPPRPALPTGVDNYVTPRGLRLLQEELASMQVERSRLQQDSLRKTGSDNPDTARNLAVLRGRIDLLERRIASARLVRPGDQPKGEVRFGASVTLTAEDGDSRAVTIVGVDEGNPSEARLAFLAPMARKLNGLRRGDEIPWPTPRGPKSFRVTEIRYDGDNG